MAIPNCSGKIYMMGLFGTGPAVSHFKIILLLFLFFNNFFCKVCEILL